jgi:TolB-like protein/DNA-binding winged helix-turn-helix (wHTH) protein
VFEVDPGAGQIRKHGHRMRLDGKALQLLLALLERPGEVVSREELRQRLWREDVFVEFDKNLNNAVARLREVLGDSAQAPHYVETVPRRGYRFIRTVDVIRPVEAGDRRRCACPLRVARAAIPAQASRRAAAVVAAVRAAGLLGMLFALRPTDVHVRSIVILPFETAASGEGDNAAPLALGITDELTTELSRLEGLRVVSATSARWYKATGQTASQIAQALDVDAVVEGSVFLEGSSVRVNVQLIDGPRALTWADTYTREMGSLLALQLEVARAVADRIHLTLTPEQQARLGSARRVEPAVEEAYLLGRYWVAQGTEAGRQRGRVYFEQAIARDPAHAPSYAGLADVYNLSDAIPATEAYARAREFALKALALDGTLSEAHASLGYIHYYGDHDWGAATRELRRALELDVNNVQALRWYGTVIGAMGRTEEGLVHTRRGMQLDPVSLEVLDSAAAAGSGAGIRPGPGDRPADARAFDRRQPGVRTPSHEPRTARTVRRMPAGCRTRHGTVGPGPALPFAGGVLSRAPRATSGRRRTFRRPRVGGAGQLRAGVFPRHRLHRARAA